MLSTSTLSQRKLPSAMNAANSTSPCSAPVPGAEAVPTNLSVSTTFPPTTQFHSRFPDLILVSADLCFFYVHSDLFERLSDNGFHNLLPVAYATPTGIEPDCPLAILGVPEDSSVLNILLHAVYELDSAQYLPSLATLIKAVNSMHVYGLSPGLTILPSTPLFILLLAHAAHAPLKLYCLAGHHGMEALAVATSAHLLSFRLATLTDAAAIDMGAIYLRRQAATDVELAMIITALFRLCFLLVGRTEALKRVLLQPPLVHAATAECSMTRQHALTREWALTAARLAEDLRPDISTYALEFAMRPLAVELRCSLCRSALSIRVQDLTAQWAVVKRTI
ncbi:hypothetical protein C8R46DRAFT_1278738 [Mycena filopes]|nr:hypothetical protein C8R46DRAFT_1278738 [Mycena filopes]